MARPLGKIRIMVSASALFDLREEDEIYKKDPKAYIDMMVGMREVPLKKGAAFEFIRGMLELNKVAAAAGYKESLVEITLFSKNDTRSGLRIENSIQHYGFDFEMRSYVNGRALNGQDLDAYGTDLFLTTNQKDAQIAIDAGVAAAVMNPRASDYAFRQDGKMHLWFDGDAVAFGDTAERRYRDEGLENYKRMEQEDRNNPVEAGPFTAFLVKLGQLREEFKQQKMNFPIHLSLLTARGGKAAARAMETINRLGISFDDSHFMGGAKKRTYLAKFDVDIFFDDQVAHTGPGSEVVPCATVPYRTGSAMFEFMAKQEAAKTVKAQAKENAAECCGKGCEHHAANMAKAKTPRNLRHQGDTAKAVVPKSAAGKKPTKARRKGTRSINID